MARRRYRARQAAGQTSHGAPPAQRRAARDGAEALDALAERPADLALADVMIPEQDGLEVRALAAGAHDYLVKPFTARELIARIESQLALARLRSSGTR